MRESKDALERRLRDHHEIHTFADMPHRAVERIKEVSAARTRLLSLGPKHEAVDHQRIHAGREELRQPYARRLTVFACRLKDVVFLELSADRQRSAFGCDPLDLPTQLSLLFKQRASRPAVGRALVGEVNVVKRLLI